MTLPTYNVNDNSYIRKVLVRAFVGIYSMDICGV